MRESVYDRLSTAAMPLTPTLALTRWVANRLPVSRPTAAATDRAGCRAPFSATIAAVAGWPALAAGSGGRIQWMLHEGAWQSSRSRRRRATETTRKTDWGEWHGYAQTLVDSDGNFRGRFSGLPRHRFRWRLRLPVSGAYLWPADRFARRQWPLTRSGSRRTILADPRRTPDATPRSPGVGLQFAGVRQRTGQLPRSFPVCRGGGEPPNDEITAGGIATHPRLLPIGPKRAAGTGFGSKNQGVRPSARNDHERTPVKRRACASRSGSRTCRPQR